MYSSSLAVDGNSYNGGKHCAHTRAAKNSWWQVDLTAIYEILEIVVTSQRDSEGITGLFTRACVFACLCVRARVCVLPFILRELGFTGNKLRDFVVQVLNQYNDPPITVCATVGASFELGETRRIRCHTNVYGNVVKVQLNGVSRRILSLCEVKVYGLYSKLLTLLLLYHAQRIRCCC